MWRYVYFIPAVASILATLALAVEPADVHRGRVTSVSAQRISIIDSAGENESFEVAPEVKVTHNGKPAKLSDIDEGDVAILTVKIASGKAVVLTIEARDME